jgi:hypothetical protein
MMCKRTLFCGTRFMRSSERLMSRPADAGSSSLARTTRPTGAAAQAAAALVSEAALRAELSALGDGGDDALLVRRAADAARARAARAQRAAVPLAFGMYARHCAEVNAFMLACVGCVAPSVVGVAMVDAVPASGRCAGVAHTVESAAVLPRRVEPLDPADMRYWPRTHALFQLLVARAPRAAWFVKLDADTFFNADELRAVLGVRAAQLAAAHVDYIGKELRLFSYKGARLVYMQGGGYVLSARAARAAAACTLGSWRRCPNRVFEDLHNKQVNAQIRRSCFVPQTIAEDLYMGTCMQEANFTPSAQPCMLTLGAATVHAGENQTQHANSSAARHAVMRHSDHDVRSRMGRLLKTRCACPITVHPLKSAGQLLWVRNRSLERGCHAK